VVSGDGDMLQLVQGKVSVFSPSRNDYCTVDTFEKYTKGYPHGRAWLAGKCLQGEPPTGDNIPGIRGLGPVYAIKILQAHDWSLPEILTNPSEELKSSKLGQAILCAEGRARINKNYKLMSLLGHKTVKESKIETRVGRFDKRAIQINLAKNQFSSLLASFNQFITPFMSFGD
jgi:5'-3' exonuclease